MAETITNVSVGIVTGERSKIDGATVKNGRIYFSKDTGELFYDWNDARVQVCPQTAPNNGTLTIKQNSSTLGTFTANQAGNTEVNITVPSLSDLDASFTATAGNAITGIGQVDGKITTVKYGTFLTSHQSLADYATKTWVNSSIQALDASFTAGTNQAIVGIGQVDGKITTAKYGTFLTSHQSLADYATKTWVNSSIQALDSSFTAADGKAITGIGQVDGKITTVAYGDAGLKILKLNNFIPTQSDAGVEIGSQQYGDASAAAILGITVDELNKLLDGYYDCITWDEPVWGTTVSETNYITHIGYKDFKSYDSPEKAVNYLIPIPETSTPSWFWAGYTGTKYNIFTFTNKSGATGTHMYWYKPMLIDTTTVGDIYRIEYSDELWNSDGVPENSQEKCAIRWWWRTITNQLSAGDQESPLKYKTAGIIYNDREYYLTTVQPSPWHYFTFTSYDSETSTLYWIKATRGSWDPTDTYRLTNWTNGSISIPDITGYATQEWVNSSLANYSKGNSEIYKGTCSTGATTAAKVVTCSAFTSAKLVKGAIIFVTFDYTNTAAVGSITMNVNSTGAKPIKKIWMNAVSNLNNNQELQANETYIFQYDGTNWVCMNCDWTYTYSKITTSDIDNLNTGNNWCIDGSLLKYAVDKWAPTPDLTNYVTKTYYNTNMPNNYSNLQVVTQKTGGNTVSFGPDSSKDTLVFKAGDNVTLGVASGETAGADQITINAASTTYTGGNGINVNNTNNTIDASIKLKVNVSNGSTISSSVYLPVTNGIAEITFEAGDNVSITTTNSGNIKISASGFVIGEGINKIRSISVSDYEALATKDASTLYVLTADVE